MGSGWVEVCGVCEELLEGALVAGVSVVSIDVLVEVGLDDDFEVGLVDDSKIVVLSVDCLSTAFLVYRILVWSSQQGISIVWQQYSSSPQCSIYADRK